MSISPELCIAIIFELIHCKTLLRLEKSRLVLLSWVIYFVKGGDRLANMQLVNSFLLDFCFSNELVFLLDFCISNQAGEKKKSVNSSTFFSLGILY